MSVEMFQSRDFKSESSMIVADVAIIDDGHIRSDLDCSVHAIERTSHTSQQLVPICMEPNPKIPTQNGICRV